MNAADDALSKAADSIATGEVVDWEGLSQGLDPDHGRVLKEMEVLERIAAFLRTDTPDTSDEVPPPRSQPSSPRSWGHFTRLELLGEGGFGSVYRVRDTKLQTDVALKLIPLPADRDVRPTLALKEARLLARVRHSNVVSVFGADIRDSYVGIWMELIEGRTLSALLRQNGPFSAHEAALVGIDLCRALAAVHAAGLIHGDIKTRNVMRAAGGRTVLMDFGTGADLFGLRLQGAARGIAGTPLYLAPEVFDGSARSTVTDIYSLGVLLYHLVTDAYPVKGQSAAEVEDAHRRGERRGLRDARPDLPQGFIAAVEQAISVDPESRFQTAGAFERALGEFLGQPARDEPRPRARKLKQETLAWWLPASVAAAALVAIGLAAFLLGRGATPAQPRAATADSPPVAAPAQAGTYTIETAMYRRRGSAETQLHAGDSVAPGDLLSLRLRVSVPTYVYVVNEADRGESFMLFPLPGQAVDNPLPASSSVRLPGVAGREVSWVVSSAGEREHFLIFASPDRIQPLEELFATLPRPSFDRQAIDAAKIPDQTIVKLRSVGGLAVSEPTPSRPRFANLFTAPLTDSEETAHGLWVRQLTVENPASRR
jgi:serine/threonine-protein kinase